MNLSTLFQSLKDSRNNINQIYSFEYLIISSLCAVMAGEYSFRGIADYAEINHIYFEQYFDLSAVSPCHSTYYSLYSSLDHENFTSWFMGLTKKIMSSLEGISEKNHIAIDGKSIRNSDKNKNNP